MRLMTKLATAFRGGVRESAEMMVDANALRIFAQEIHEGEQSINHAKQQLATIIAQKAQTKRELDRVLTNKADKEAKIATLLSAGNETEALQQAQLIAEKQPLIDKQTEHYQKLVAHESTLRENLKKMVNRLAAYKHEYHMLKATDSLHTAQTRLSKHRNTAQSNFGDMQDSLTRIQSRQQTFSDQLAAMDEVDAYLNDEPTHAETVDSAAKDILASIRQKSA